MKALPLHLGHLYLIDTAISQSEMVHVIMTHNLSQSIPGEVRFESLNVIYGNNPKVKIYSVSDEELPQYDSECETLDQFYSYWVPLVYNQVEELDAVFTSEDYGDDFARYLGVKHILVDKERVKFPVSGTKIRNNTIKYWNFIPEVSRHNFVKRISIMGPESVGKSTLTERLAKYYDTNYLEEWGRVVYERNGNHVSLEDFITISKERSEQEKKLLKHSNKLFFTDTEDITTYIFSKMFYPNDWMNIKDWFESTIEDSSKYDIYILLYPDCEGVQDGTREFLDNRISHYEEIKMELKNRKLNFVEVNGNWEDRFTKSIKEINKLFNI